MVIHKITSHAIHAYQQKINKTEDKVVNAEHAGRAAGSEPAAAEQARRTQADKVQLSPEGKELQKLRDIVLKAPEVREEKVQSIKDQIKAGTYEVSADQLANKLLGGKIDEKA